MSRHAATIELPAPISPIDPPEEQTGNHHLVEPPVHFFEDDWPGSSPAIRGAHVAVSPYRARGSVRRAAVLGDTATNIPSPRTPPHTSDPIPHGAGTANTSPTYIARHSSGSAAYDKGTGTLHGHIMSKPDDEAGVQDASIAQAVREVLGSTSHAQPEKPARSGGRPPRAQIVGFSTMRELAKSSQAGNTKRAIYEAVAVNQFGGTFAMSESTYSRVDAETSARGFARAMEAQGTSRTRLKTATKQIQRTTESILPTIIERSRSVLSQDKPLGEAATTVAQIVDNKLVYSGHMPLFVYSPSEISEYHPNGTLTRLMSHNGSAQGHHVLAPGRNIVIMGGENIQTNNLGGVIDQVLSGIAAAGHLKGQAQSAGDPNALSRHIAEQIQQALHARGVTGSITVGIIETEDKWRDERSAVAQKLDYLRPSALIYGGIQRIRFPERPPREVYESKTRIGLIGRNAARLGDAALVGAVLAAGIAVPAHVVSLPTLPSPLHHRPAAIAAQAAPQEALLSPTIPNQQAAPNTPAQPLTAQPTPGRPEIITATRHDDGDKPSTVTGLAQQALRYYGEAAGMSAAQSAELAHKQTEVGKLVITFMRDTHSPNNARVLHSELHWLYAGTRYSMHDLNVQAATIANARAHELGVSAPAITTPVTTQAPTPQSQKASATTAKSSEKVTPTQATQPAKRKSWLSRIFGKIKP